MKTTALDKAVELANKVGYVFISTADAGCRPHVAVARTLALKDPGRIEVNEWFCPGTMSNLQKNSHVSIVVWNAKTDTGYQLLGDMEHVADIGMLDGYTPDMKSKFNLPQIKSQLIIKVNKITDFKSAPHTDVEE
jgi:hypothetical protein